MGSAAAGRGAGAERVERRPVEQGADGVGPHERADVVEDAGLGDRVLVAVRGLRVAPIGRQVRLEEPVREALEHLRERVGFAVVEAAREVVRELRDHGLELHGPAGDRERLPEPQEEPVLAVGRAGAARVDGRRPVEGLLFHLRVEGPRVQGPQVVERAAKVQRAAVAVDRRRAPVLVRVLRVPRRQGVGRPPQLLAEALDGVVLRIEVAGVVVAEEQREFDEHVLREAEARGERRARVDGHGLAVQETAAVVERHVVDVPEEQVVRVLAQHVAAVRRRGARDLRVRLLDAPHDRQSRVAEEREAVERGAEDLLREVRRRKLLHGPPRRRVVRAAARVALERGPLLGALREALRRRARLHAPPGAVAVDAAGVAAVEQAEQEVGERGLERVRRAAVLEAVPAEQHAHEPGRVDVQRRAAGDDGDGAVLLGELLEAADAHGALPAAACRFFSALRAGCPALLVE